MSALPYRPLCLGASLAGGLCLSTTASALGFDLLGTFETGVFDESAAEIVAFDPATNRMFVVNGDAGAIDVLQLDPVTPGAPTFLGTLDLGGGAPNSVAVDAGVVVAAVAADPETDPGRVVFFNADVDLASPVVPLAEVTVGALPDMVTFTPDGSKVLTANEGEPDADAGIDPEGSVSIIDISQGLANATAVTADFTAFNAQREALVAAGVRIFADVATVAQDLEPEYIAISGDSTTAYVTLQENNALAVVDIPTATTTAILPLGTKDHSAPGAGLDASDDDGVINIQNWPVRGMYMPDAIAAFEAQGMTFLITANEGDDRGEDERVADLMLDPTAFPDAATLQQDVNLGRLGVSSIDGDVDGDGDFDQLFSYGARSFTIWNAAGELVFDSGEELEQLTAQQVPDFFNSSNDENEFDNRSDNKGPEPEGVTTGQVGAVVLAFVGLERIGGVVVYDVTTPTAPALVTYLLNRDFAGDPAAGTAGDLGPEGLLFISATDSPYGFPLLVVTNEVSGTTTVYGLDPNDPLTSDREFVAQLYRDILNREGEMAGIEGWLAELASGNLNRAGLVAVFLTSDEAQLDQRFPDLTAFEAQVQALYEDLLNRAPDATGFAFWVGRLEEGASLQAVSQAYLDALEYRRRFLP